MTVPAGNGKREQHGRDLEGMSRELSETQQAQQHLGPAVDTVRIAAAAQQPAALRGGGRSVT
jgi:hypothetical protein